MPEKPKPRPDDPEQFARFRQAAAKAGLDDSAEAFDRAFAKVAPPKTKAPEAK